jgi:peptide/nickel transport system permease protein
VDAGGPLVRAQFLSACAKRSSSRRHARSAPRTSRQVVRHILPERLGPVIVAATIDVAAAIIAESTLSFLGPGLPAGHPHLGPHPVRRQVTTWTSPSHWAMFPGLAIFLTVLTINFIGDGLRDALDPRRVL